MNPYLICVILEALIIAILVGILLWRMQVSDKERRDLYNRIQSGTIERYVTAKPLAEYEPEKPKRRRIERVQEDEPETVAYDPAADTSAAEAFAALSNLGT